MISFEEAKEIYLNGIGASGQELSHLVEKAGQSDLPVLIQGEKGTGKGIIAQAIHRGSARCGRPFVSVNCAVFSPSDLYCELFGIKKDLDSKSENIYALTLADSGTLLISGIDKTDTAVQARLLDVMEGLYPYQVDMRFIGITRQDLYSEVLKNNFNENLYYRLSVLTINLIPLRHRKNDIPLIAEKIIRNNKQNILKGFSKEALEVLTAYDWPGNMRELESVIKRAAVLAENEYISPRDIIFPKERLSDIPEIKNETVPCDISSGILIDNLKSDTSFLDKQITPSDDLYYRETIKKFSHVINCILNINELLKTIINMILEVMHGESISLLLLDNSDWEYSIKDMVGLSEELKEKFYFKPSKQLVKLLVDDGKILILSELKNKLVYPEYSEMAKFMEDINADICAPLIIEGFLIGFCNLGFDKKLKNDTVPDLELFYILSAQAASAIKSALTYSHILETKDAKENILKNIMSGIITVNIKNKVTTFNKRAENITGYKVEDVLGKDVSIIGSKFAEIISGALIEGKAYVRVELKIPTKDKVMVTIGMSTSHLRDEAGNLVGVIVVFADLSEGLQIETQIRRTERLESLTTLATGLAHEIKNPLVSIKTFTQLLPQKFNDKEFRNNYYEVVTKEIERLDNLIEKLVNFSHLGNPNFSRHKIEGIVLGSLNILEDEILKRKIEIKQDFEGDTFDILLDPEQIKIVFCNVLANAIESMPKGGVVSIVVKNQKLRQLRNLDEKLYDESFLTEGDFVEIIVQDTGCGIDENNLNKIFNPFFTTKYGAVGLGLTIVHQIIEGHNGIIKIKSVEGQGTTISINLPVEQNKIKSHDK
ncbi:MAG: sigma 54-interacting transcriptional regulator [bacterium]|nr:sigma 54-interacting transcriptional regulator [bacterium]